MLQLSKYLIQIWMVSLFWHRHKETCWPNKPQCSTFRTHYKNSFWTASLCLLFILFWPSGVKSLFFLLPVCVCVFDPLLSGKFRLSLRVEWQLHPHPPSEPVAIVQSGISLVSDTYMQSPLSDTPTLSAQNLFLCCSYFKNLNVHNTLLWCFQMTK